MTELGRGLCLALCLGAGPVWAEGTVLTGDLIGCLDQQTESNQPMLACIDAAQSACDADGLDAAAAAAACYLTAKEEWGWRIAGFLDGFPDRSDRFRQIARIEARFGLSRHLLDCEHQHALSLVGRTETENDRVAKAHCDATAYGTTLVDLLFKSGAVGQ